jgi:Putative addiction module component
VSVELPVEQMSVAEKLRAMELLWENLRRDEKNVPVPQWHRDLLDERERLIREGKAHFEDWDAAKKSIAKKSIAKKIREN